MGRCDRGRRGVFAVEDACALSDEIARARSSPGLDPRLEPFLDRAARRLRAVRDEAGLDAALAELRPVLDALAQWPAPLGAQAPWDGPRRDGGLSDLDVRVLRFGAAYSALWALERTPDDEAARARGADRDRPRPPHRARAADRDVTVTTGARLRGDRSLALLSDQPGDRRLVRLNGWMPLSLRSLLDERGGRGGGPPPPG